jgi:hypothetical protein
MFNGGEKWSRKNLGSFETVFSKNVAEALVATAVLE